MAHEFLQLALAAIPIISGIITLAVAAAVYRKLPKILKLHACFFSATVAIFVVAFSAHFWHHFAENNFYDTVANFILFFGFVLLGVSSLVALKVAKEFGFRRIVPSAAMSFPVLSFAFVMPQTTVNIMQIISLSIGLFAAALSFFAWRKMTEGHWGSVYFCGFMLRAFLIVAVIFALAESEVTSYFFVALGFAAFAYTAAQMKNIAAPFSIKA